MPDNVATRQSQLFTGANYSASAENLSEDEVRLATNVDFSLGRGAATVRRGSIQLANHGTAAIAELFRHNNTADYGSSPTYFSDSDGNVRQLTGGLTSTATTLASGGATDQYDITAFQSYREDVFIASGTVGIRSNGTNSTPWVKTRPPGTLAITTNAPDPVVVTSTWTVVEGSTGTHTTVATATTDPDTQQIELRQIGDTTDLNTNSVIVGTTTTAVIIGDFGVHTISLKFDQPRNVQRISIDYSIGTDTATDTGIAAFTNYFHAELDLTQPDADMENYLNLQPGSPDPEKQIDGAIEAGAGDDVAAAVEQINEAKAVSRQRTRPNRQRIGRAKNTFNVWTIPVTEFEIVGKDPGTGWSLIGENRVIIECSAPTVVEVTEHEIHGAETFGLHDQGNGYVYWETFAKLGTDSSGNVFLDEQTGPSPPTARTRIQHSNVVVVSTSTAVSTDSMSHRILYRNGGFLNDAYAVGTFAIATATITDTRPDVQVLLENNVMPRNLRSKVPAYIRTISPPFRDRLFVGFDNTVAWTLPGNPGAFPLTSRAEISHKFDRVQKLISAGNSLVVVNRDSVYTLRGNIFEGDLADYVVQKTAAKGGSVAPRATILTPFGILLVREEGLFLYEPGSQRDEPITWAMERLGDLFMGNGQYDPARLKGRVGNGLDQAALPHCVAAYYNNKIWFGYPDSASSSANNRVNRFAILDMLAQKVWIYDYSTSFNVRSILPNRDSNILLIGSTAGSLMRLEQGLTDHDDSNNEDLITWSVGSRIWTVSNDTVAENVFLETEGQNHCVVTAVFDGTTTVAAGTITEFDRDWSHLALNGRFSNSVYFDVAGTQTQTENATLYHLEWDMLGEPKRVNYFRTEHFNGGTPDDKIWDVHYSDIEVTGTGNVTGVVFIDNTAIMTATITGPTNGRIIYEKSFPLTGGYAPRGEIAYTTYSGVEFKLWEARYSARPEPPKMTEYEVAVKCEDENLWERYNVCINPGGTSTHIVRIDNTVVDTFTCTGSTKQSYVFAHGLSTGTTLDEDTQWNFGRTALVSITGGPFKHYDSWWDKKPEPDRVLNYVWYPDSFPSGNYLRTWVPELNCLGGTVTGTLYADGTVVHTASFTGSRRRTYSEALDLSGTASNVITTASRLHGEYRATSVFKHYQTQVESKATPFGKLEWTINYTKIGGASRLDMARAFGLDVEPESSGTATLTCVLDIDGTPFQTNTLTFTARDWQDNIPYGPGGRGYIYQQRIWSGQRFKVWDSALDLHREGRKGVSYLTIKGTPQ